MNSEEEASGSEAESESRSSSGSESDGVAGIVFASSPASKIASNSFFTNYSNKDETLAYCFMAKSKVSSCKVSYVTLEEDTLDLAMKQYAGVSSSLL